MIKSQDMILTDNGEQLIAGPRGVVSVITRVATSTTSAQLLVSNESRILAVVVNESNKTMYLKFGATASVTDYTYSIGSGDTLEVERYTGRIDAILDTGGSGNAQATEIT